MILIVDNYDSFTYNLYQYVRALGRDAVIFRNDEIDCESIEKLDISHDGRGVFKSVADGFHAIRYHSLEVIDKEDSKLELSARSGDGCIMAFSHQIYNTYGLQFHPESIGSQYGKELIGNFLNMKGGKR